jgi:hypothetical protein
VTRVQRPTAEEEDEVRRVEWEQHRDPNEMTQGLDLKVRRRLCMSLSPSLCEEKTTQDWKEFLSLILFSDSKCRLGATYKPQIIHCAK